MQMKELKKAIETEFDRGNLDRVSQLMEQYETDYPQDIELVAMKTNYYIQQMDVEQAYRWAREGVRRLPLNADMQYNLAYVQELRGELYEAIQHYFIADYLYEWDEQTQIREELAITEHANELVQILEEQCRQCEDSVERENRLELLKNLLALSASQFGLRVEDFRAESNMIGQEYAESLYEKRYVGAFKDQRVQYGVSSCKDVLSVKAEFLEVQKDKSCMLNDSQEPDETEYLLPVAVGENGKVLHRFVHGDQCVDVAQIYPGYFNYYRVKNHTILQSSDTSYYGKPIKLAADKDKKRLVLSIFVDGLSQTILSQEDFRNHMPHTYRYFKKGTIFERAYSAAEWTYPSIINYVTGLQTSHHMVFHNKIDYWMPEDVPTLAQYFQAAGYYTAMFNGDWRIIPPYGHARGYDRFVWQHQLSGNKVHEVVSDVMNHIDAFRETNQYVWMSIGDLHDIADEMSLPVGVQKELSLSWRAFEENGPTSAKQSYSENKRMQFIKQAAYVDRWLKVLFDYIEENYKEEEVVVSLFADHGQGYLIPNDAHFLAKERSNVAFMFRGGAAEGIGSVDELVSACDYSLIMQKLCEIDLPQAQTDGRLPMIFGGAQKRAYAMTESIHPNDPYYAAVFGEKETFFFLNPEPVQTDGRFHLGEYRCWLEDAKGNRMQDEALERSYLELVRKQIAPILIYE